MMNLLHVTSQSFDREVAGANIPVLVDFHATWCGPCRMLSPTLEKLSQEFAGKVKFVKVDVDQEPALASRFHVQSLPTLAVMVQGQVIGQSSGLVAEGPLRTAIKEIANMKTN